METNPTTVTIPLTRLRKIIGVIDLIGYRINCQYLDKIQQGGDADPETELNIFVISTVHSDLCNMAEIDPNYPFDDAPSLASTGYTVAENMVRELESI